MRKSTALLAAVSFIFLIIESCSKTSEDKLDPQTPAGCDTVNMTYATDVVPILQANCYNCHGNGSAEGGVNLDTHDNVKTIADNGALLGTITHASGYPPMPQGGAQLSDCDINMIRSWINRGSLNN